MWMFNFDMNQERHKDFQQEAERQQWVREALKARRSAKPSSNFPITQILTALGRLNSSPEEALPPSEILPV